MGIAGPSGEGAGNRVEGLRFKAMLFGACVISVLKKLHF